MESIPQVKFFRGKLLQFVWTYQVVHTFVVLVKTLQEHNERLKKVFLKITESRLTLNKTKYQIRKKLIVFLGQDILSEGIKIDLSETEQLLKWLCQGQLMSYRDFLVWLIT